ncbi:DMT family transporter [Saccharopolyspora phatthalungensis]|uniref:Drug/metabolite transporter (DMT)-like permease n=1 Tax=Saccharopolyspora phatthalungensis TaxID=664693 RepID=A0A840Q9V7_9PSEU|nr:DMT family transporter [Saccharopolyspora phatthalungensis]MBB5157216.1 drug/metabolite transporter (DMT)-like permease [Saccharopolyspora phatthalungensis]
MVKGSVCAFLAMIMVGSSVAVMGMLRDFPVYAGQAFRFTLAAALLLVVLRVRTQRSASTASTVTPRQWVRIGLLAAIGMVGFNVAIAAAEQDTDPALVGVIVGCAPIVIALITPLMARRPPSYRMILAGIVVAAGAASAQGLGSTGSATGILLSIGAMAGEVVFALVAAPILSDLGALRVSTYACVLAVPLCLLGMLITGEFRLPDTEQLLALAWLGAVVTACAYVLWFTAVGTIGAERAGLFPSVVPISAVAVTALLGTGTPTWGHVAGAIVVLVGLLIGLTSRTKSDVIVAEVDKPTDQMPQH